MAKESIQLMNIYRTILILTGTVFCLTACDQSNRQSRSENKSQSIDSLVPAPTVSDKKDTLASGPSGFPADSSFEIRILHTGNFHGDEVWPDAGKGNWFGLFRNNNGYYLAETELKTKRIHDPVLDGNANEKTGWEVQTINKDPSVLLMEGIKSLTPRKVQQAVLSKKQVLPGDSLRISYLGIDYIIFATGSKRKLQHNPEEFEVLDYKLYVSATIKGQPYKSLLVAQPDFDDQMITLIFAGDIDGDRILDLIIDTSRHYNHTSPTLYLSIPAKNKELVKPVGSHSSVGG